MSPVPSSQPATDALFLQLVAGLLTLAGVVVGILGTYWLQFRQSRISDESARVLADVRLIEAIMLLLPSLQSGELREGNIAVLKSRLERLDDPVIYTAYRRHADRLGSIGQVEIATLRLFLMLGPRDVDARSVRQSAEAGIANALRAIWTPSLRGYAEALAKSCGFTANPDSYVIAGVRRSRSNGDETWRFTAGDDPRPKQ
jgi:hypothetical protein